MVSMQAEENSQNTQSAPSPQCVGREFVRQYYTLLAEAPKYVHRFYSNESVFVHGSDTDEVIGQSAIGNKISELNFHECRTRIRGLDAHETLGKGVVVQVVGEISVSGGPMRRFVQTFVLAPQSEKKYYVHNDIFRYEDELFGEKRTQENGTPADPEAEEDGIVDQDLQGSVTNGDAAHDQDMNISKQYPPMQSATQPVSVGPMIPTHPSNQPSPYGTVAAEPGFPPESTFGWESGDTNIPQQPAPPAAAPPLPVAPITMPYIQQPLPQRTQMHEPPPPPEPMVTTVADPAAPEQQPCPPRSQSVEKSSPVPSDEHENVDTAPPGTCSWAMRVKNRPSAPPSITQQQQQQPPVLASQGPGTSGPSALSPTAGGVPPNGGPVQQDFANRQQPYSQMKPMGRPNYPHRQPRQQHGAMGTQDVRLSGPGGGQQPNVPGGGPRNFQQGPVDILPCEQQVYIRNIPLDLKENDLKQFLESEGYSGIAEARIIRKKIAGTQQTCSFAFVAFDSTEVAQRLIQQKNMNFHGAEMVIDIKRTIERVISGGSGNFPHPGNRPYPPSAPQGAAFGRAGGGGQNARGVMAQRGGLGSNRGGGQGSGGYMAAGGGGGPRQQGSRTFHHSAGRPGAPQHHQ